MLNTEKNMQAEDPLLVGRLDSIKPLLDALNCIYSPLRKGQDVQMLTQPTHGIKFTIEETGCLLASVILPRSSFAEFRQQPSLLRIRLNLSLLLDCLQIFGNHNSVDRFSSASVSMTYHGDGYPLVLKIRDAEKDCMCELATMENMEHEYDFQFHAHRVLNRVVIHSETMREALGELEYGGATTAELRMAPEVPRLVLSSPAWALGVDGGEEAVCRVEFADPGDRKADTFQMFESERMQTAGFRLEHLARCVKALGMSESCKVEMNEVGMVSIMCRMKGDGGGGGLERCFVEFIVVAQEIDEDGEDEGQL